MRVEDITKQSESQIQRAAVHWFRIVPRDIEPLFFCVPNGGYRCATTARIMKAEGQRAGVADLILLVPRQGYCALCIEMKTRKGYQSEAQKVFQAKCEEYGAKYVVCRSLDEFQKVVRWYLGEEKSETAHNRSLLRSFCSGG